MFLIFQIFCQDVEKFASRRAERGVQVQMVLFTNSPHVKHYATYRDVYVNTVCHFINESLRKKELKIEENKPNCDEEDIIFQETLSGLTKRVVLPQEATK